MLIHPIVKAAAVDLHRRIWLNDASVATGLLSRLAAEQSHLVAPASFAAGWLVGRGAADLHALRKPWRRFTTMKPPWALAR